MTRPRILRIELARSERPNEPYAFDGNPQEYVARGARGKLGTAVFPWDKVDALRTEFLHPAPTGAVRRKMGDLLRRFLEDVLKELKGWASYEDALIKAEENHTPIRLLFRFSAGELFSLPWSLTTLSKGGRSLGSIVPHPLHFEWANDVVAPLDSPTHGRVLFAWSDAEHDVSEDGHLAALQRACSDFDLEQDQLKDVNLDSLRSKLEDAHREGKPVRILHILCHGSPLSGGTFGLLWTNPQRPGRPARIDGDSLRDVLAPYRSDLRAIVLSACHGSNPGQVGSMFGGVAHDLHRLGIPAVIASQMPLTVDGSIQMTEALYEALCKQKLPIDEAFQKAHAALSASSLDWASLQFFALSAEDARERGQRMVFSSAETLPELSEEVVVAYEVNFNVAPASIAEALKGQAGEDLDVVVLQPFDKFRDDLPSTAKEWRHALEHADQLVDALGVRVSMVHLLGRAPLPLMFHLGWRLSRCKLRVYQEQRGRTGIWTCGYDSEQRPSSEEQFFRAEAWPDREACLAAQGRLAMTIEVNLSIHAEELTKWLGTEAPPALVRLVAARGPSPTVLRGPMDTAHAVDEFRACLDRIHAEWPDVREVWLALACPASLAAALGRAYNPKTQATFKLFNFRKSEGYVEVPWSGGITRKHRRRS
jgi:hypothetical protein